MNSAERITYPKTWAIRRYIELGRSMHSSFCSKMLHDQQIPELKHKTPREVINRGGAEEVLAVFQRRFERQPIPTRA